MQMSDERRFSDGITQQATNFNKCESKKSLDPNTATQDEKFRENVTSGLDFPTDKLGNCNHFIHEPEELSALYDSRLHFPIISLMFDDKMASSTTQLALIDKDLNSTVNDEKKTLTEEDDLSNELKMQSLQAFDELASDLCKNKHCTDADVLNAVCVFSERASPVNNADLAMGADNMSQYNFLEKVSSIIQSEMLPDNSSLTSLDYWSDEEGLYLPQMSLSPPPGEQTLRKTTQKELKKYDEKEYLRSLRTNYYVEDPSKSNNVVRTQPKRQPMNILSPIISKHPPYPSHSHKYQTTPNGKESTSQNITPSFLINSADNVAKSMMPSQPYNRKPKASYNDWAISSPSLVRPTVATPPRTRKNVQSSATTEIFGLNYSRRIKEDKLFDTQRSLMAKRQVSRTQSSNTPTTKQSKLFPVISGIGKSQGTSKSISDFRQSSSIFGKLVKKNSVKQKANDMKKDIDSNKQSKAANSTSTGSSRSRVGETARRKLRRVLSLH